MWIDTHAHLFDLTSEQLDNTINEAVQSSIGLIISTAVDIETCKKVLQHCRQFPVLSGAIGISPFDIENLDSNWNIKLRSMLNEPKIIAVGEIGLDSSNPKYPPIEKQLPFFIEQLTIAKEAKVPAIIHSRGAEQFAADICKKEEIDYAVFHCFTGDYSAARKILDLGYYLSFSGIITFKNSDLSSLIPKIPVDRILIETDSPYLAPVPFRGKQNKPSFLPVIGAQLAQILSINVNDLQIILRKNFNTCFKIDK